MYYDFGYSPFDVDMPGDFGNFAPTFHTMGHPQFRRGQQERHGSPSATRRTPAPQQQPAPSSSFYPEEDPFHGRDSIPIKVIHEYSNRPRTETAPAETVEEEPVKAPEAPPSPRTIPIKVVHEEKSPGQKRKPQKKEKKLSGEKTVPVTVVPDETPVEEITPKQHSLDQIKAVGTALTELAPEIEAFSGEKASYQYRYLDEMLTRNLIKLDDVQTHGDDEVRAKRKEVVKRIQGLADQLDSKVVKVSSSDEVKAEHMETSDVATHGGETPEKAEPMEETEEKAGEEQSAEISSTADPAEEVDIKEKTEDEEMEEEKMEIESMTSGAPTPELPGEVAVTEAPDEEDQKPAVEEKDEVEFEDVSDREVEDKDVKDEQQAVVEESTKGDQE